MITNFSVRVVDNGFIVHWDHEDSHLEMVHEEKVFLMKSDMEQFVTDLIRQMRLT